MYIKLDDDVVCTPNTVPADHAHETALTTPGLHRQEYRLRTNHRQKKPPRIPARLRQQRQQPHSLLGALASRRHPSLPPRTRSSS